MGAPGVEVLVAALGAPDPGVREAAARALQSSDDPRAIEGLTGAARRGDLVVVAAAYQFYVEHGVAEAIPLLIRALEGEKSQHSALARYLLNSGEPRLESAVGRWARRHGLAIIPLSPTLGPEGRVWGSK
jgi:HEAT repeat protein